MDSDSVRCFLSAAMLSGPVGLCHVIVGNLGVEVCFVKGTTQFVWERANDAIPHVYEADRD